MPKLFFLNKLVIRFLAFYFLIICVSCNDSIEGIWKLQQVKFVPQDIPIDTGSIKYKEYTNTCQLNSGYNLLRIKNRAGTINRKSCFVQQPYDSVKVKCNTIIWFANSPCRSTYTFKKEEGQLIIFDKEGDIKFIGTKITEKEVEEERVFFANSKVEINLPVNLKYNCQKVTITENEMTLQIGPSKSFTSGFGNMRNIIILGDAFITETEFREFQKADQIKNSKLLVYADQSVDLTWLIEMISLKHVFVAFKKDQEDFQICWVNISEIAD